MKLLMRLHLIYGCIAAVAVIAVLVCFWMVVPPEPHQLQKDPAFLNAVSNITDPNQFKKAITHVVVKADSVVVESIAAVKALVVFLCIILLAVAAAFFHTYFRLRSAEQDVNSKRSPEEA